MTRTVRIELGDRSYGVGIGPGAIVGVGDAIRERLGRAPTRAFVVHDAGVPAVFADELDEVLRAAGLTTARIVVTPSEPAKSHATLESILCAMAASGHARTDPVVALGGGIVGDVAGFAASCYQRGVPVVQCPTTLLSMVDASVGGKTGVNLLVHDVRGDRLLKNFVGAFHQPIAVFADTRMLHTLPDRERRAGLAECVKHAMIARSVLPEDDAGDLLAETNALLERVLAGEDDACSSLIARSVTLKGEAVRRDERESIGGEDGAGGGVRMLLNLGHTFGHAIETIAHLSPDPADPGKAPLLHGEAVALGLVAACRTSQTLGWCDASVGDEIVAVLDTIGLPTRVRGLPPTDVVRARMGSDKKASAGSVRLVLPESRGRCRVVPEPDPGATAAGIDAIRA